MPKPEEIRAAVRRQIDQRLKITRPINLEGRVGRAGAINDKSQVLTNSAIDLHVFAVRVTAGQAQRSVAGQIAVEYGGEGVELAAAEEIESAADRM